jgi:RNA polymerase sigma factor (TIGR02999 family)
MRWTRSDRPEIFPDSLWGQQVDEARLTQDDTGTQPLTHVLAALEPSSDGGGHGGARLLPLVYDELRRLAEQWMAREAPGQTLQPTALVHEAYLRLVSANGHDLRWDSRGHFFAAAAISMRRILVERARRRKTLRHGGEAQRLSLQQIAEPALDAEPEPELMLALDEALARLEQIDSRKASVVSLRYFAGLTLEKTAEALALSLTTVKEEWQFARAWLHRELGRGA